MSARPPIQRMRQPPLCLCSLCACGTDSEYEKSEMSLCRVAVRCGELRRREERKPAHANSGRPDCRRRNFRAQAARARRRRPDPWRQTAGHAARRKRLFERAPPAELSVRGGDRHWLQQSGVRSGQCAAWRRRTHCSPSARCACHGPCVLLAGQGAGRRERGSVFRSGHVQRVHAGRLRQTDTDFTD